MSQKKSKDFRFTFQDARGKLRLLVVQVQHDQEGAEDHVRVQVTSDGVPVTVSSFVHAGDRPVVKTRSRM